MEASFEYRWYQKEGIEAISKDLIYCLSSGSDEYPVGAFQTGTGKTIIMTGIVDDIVNKFPGLKIIVAAHDKRIIRQNYKAMVQEFGESFVGLYSAGLKSREVKKVTVGSIQSMYNKTDLFEDFDVMIVDECHLVNPKRAGMYRTMIQNCDLAVAGLSGSPFRLGHGYIYEGKDTIFKKLSYNLCTPENHARLVEDGFLAKMYTKATLTEFDTSDIKLKGRDYDEAQMSDAFDRDEITQACVEEIIKFGKNYKSWMVFAIDTKHANNIQEEFRKRGISAIAIHSKMDGSEDDALEDFMNGKYQVAISVNMLTTGFDHPRIDLIAHMRPTKSPVFHVQSNGRGGRPHPDKDHTLVLDFAGNFDELGPLDNVRVKTKREKKGGGEPIIKICEECGCKHHPSVRICDACGFKFQFKHKLRLGGGDFDIFSSKETTTKWVIVKSTTYNIKPKTYSVPSMLKVIYRTDCGTISELIGVEHKRGSFPWKIARNWLKHRLPEQVEHPKKVEDILQDFQILKTPTKMLVNFANKHPKILNSVFD